MGRGPRFDGHMAKLFGEHKAFSCAVDIDATSPDRPEPVGLTGQLAFLEARHRGHARVEDRIRVAKDTGLGRFPSREFKINQVWIQIAAIAADLVAWLQLIALDADLAKAEPKTLRFKMLHVPARLTRSGRQRHLRLPTDWPWASQIAAAFATILALPAPT